MRARGKGLTRAAPWDGRRTRLPAKGPGASAAPSALGRPQQPPASAPSRPFTCRRRCPRLQPVLGARPGPAYLAGGASPPPGTPARRRRARGGGLGGRPPAWPRRADRPAGRPARLGWAGLGSPQPPRSPLRRAPGPGGASALFWRLRAATSRLSAAPPSGGPRRGPALCPPPCRLRARPRRGSRWGRPLPALGRRRAATACAQAGRGGRGPWASSGRVLRGGDFQQENN